MKKLFSAMSVIAMMLCMVACEKPAPENPVEPTISFNPKKVEMFVDQKLTLTAVVEGVDNITEDDFYWECEDNKIVSLSDKGAVATLTGKSVGNTKVTVYIDRLHLEATCKIAVNEDELSVVEAKVTMCPADSIRPTLAWASGKEVDMSAVTYEYSSETNDTIMFLGQSQYIAALPGECSLKVKYEGTVVGACAINIVEPTFPNITELTDLDGEWEADTTSFSLTFAYDKTNNIVESKVCGIGAWTYQLMQISAQDSLLTTFKSNLSTNAQVKVDIINGALCYPVSALIDYPAVLGAMGLLTHKSEPNASWIMGNQSFSSENWIDDSNVYIHIEMSPDKSQFTLHYYFHFVSDKYNMVMYDKLVYHRVLAVG